MSEYTPDEPLARSYIRHGDEWFYVSTIDRDSSAMLGPRRFSETLIWKWNPETDERGELVGNHGGLQGSIFIHLKVCKRLADFGQSEEI